MKILKNICPVCVLVSSIWIVLLALRYFGYGVSESLTALLMGGSVVGISYALAKYLPDGRAALWKFLALPIGFVAAWELLHFAWGYLMVAALVYALIWVVIKKENSPEQIKKENSVDIKKQLENCCGEY